MSNNFKLKYKHVKVIDHLKTGLNMRKIRLDTGISLRGFARKCKFSPQYISDLELGLRNWSTKLVKMYEKNLE